MEAITIDPIIAKLQSCASTDESRQNIHGVNVADGLAIATTGHILVVKKLHTANETPPGLYRLSSPKKFLHLAAKTRSFSRIFKRLSDNLFASYSPEAGHVTKLDGVFPTWKTVIPVEPLTFTVSFDARLLSKIARALTDGSDEAPVVTLEFRSPNAPIVVTGKDTDSFGILMPCRIADSAQAPSKTIQQILGTPPQTEQTVRKSTSTSPTA